jgi:hypothetical protein
MTDSVTGRYDISGRPGKSAKPMSERRNLDRSG